MKKLPIFLAAALLAVACESTNNGIIGPNNGGDKDSKETAYYLIDGDSYTGSISNEFIYRMLDMAYSGHTVTFSAGKANNVNYGRAMQTVSYTTPEREKAFRWARKMSKMGFTIVISYDKTTSNYICQASK